MRRILQLILLSLALPTLAADRPNILWLIAEDFGPHLGCYGTTAGLDAQPRPAGRRGRPLHPGLHHRAGLLGEPVGVHDRHVPDHHRRPQPPLAPRRRLPLPEGVRRRSPTGCATPATSPPTSATFPTPSTFTGTGKTDWNFTYDGKPFDSDRLGRPEVRISRSSPRSTSRRRTARSTPRSRPTRPRSSSRPIIPTTPSRATTGPQYLDAATELDRKVGLILKQLEADGLADNTIVVFFGDHGQAHVRGKQFCYEEGLHIPLIIRWPKAFAAPAHFRPGTVDDRLIEAIDLAPTMLDLAGVPKPAKMQGRRLPRRPRRAAPRQYVFGARDRCDETVFRFRTVRDARYRYIRNFTPDRPFLQANDYKERNYPVWNLLKELAAQGKLTPEQEFLTAPTMPPEELYDLEADPYEIHNLATSDNPTHQAALKRLRTEVEKWITQTNDQGKRSNPGSSQNEGRTKPTKK